MALVRGKGNVALDNAMNTLERHCAYCDSFPPNNVVSTRYQTHSAGPLVADLPMQSYGGRDQIVTELLARTSGLPLTNC